MKGFLHEPFCLLLMCHFHVPKCSKISHKQTFPPEMFAESNKTFPRFGPEAEVRNLPTSWPQYWDIPTHQRRNLAAKRKPMFKKGTERNPMMKIWVPLAKYTESSMIFSMFWMDVCFKATGVFFLFTLMIGRFTTNISTQLLRDMVTWKLRDIKSSTQKTQRDFSHVWCRIPIRKSSSTIVKTQCHGTKKNTWNQQTLDFPPSIWKSTYPTSLHEELWSPCPSLAALVEAPENIAGTARKSGQNARMSTLLKMT